MGYYTTLDLKADFDTNIDNKILEIRKFADWFNSLSYEEYMGKYYYKDDWNKFIKEKNFFDELKEFLLDNRGAMVLSNFEFHSIYDVLYLSIECEIKNYTDTYDKLYALILKCNPISLLIKERGEEMKKPDIYELQNNILVQTQQGARDVY